MFVVLLENFEEPQNYIADAFTLKVGLRIMHNNGDSFERLINQFYIKFGHL